MSTRPIGIAVSIEHAQDVRAEKVLNPGKPHIITVPAKQKLDLARHFVAQLMSGRLVPVQIEAEALDDGHPISSQNPAVEDLSCALLWRLREVGYQFNPGDLTDSNRGVVELAGEIFLSFGDLSIHPAWSLYHAAQIAAHCGNGYHALSLAERAATALTPETKGGFSRISEAQEWFFIDVARLLQDSKAPITSALGGLEQRAESARRSL